MKSLLANSMASMESTMIDPLLTNRLIEASPCASCACDAASGLPGSLAFASDCDTKLPGKVTGMKGRASGNDRFKGADSG